MLMGDFLTIQALEAELQQIRERIEGLKSEEAKILDAIEEEQKRLDEIYAT